MPPQKKKSDIWNHFSEANDNKRAKCTYCFQYISFSGGALSNLNRHFKRKHPSVVFPREKSDFVEVNCTPHTSIQPTEATLITSKGSIPDETSCTSASTREIAAVA